MSSVFSSSMTTVFNKEGLMHIIKVEPTDYLGNDDIDIEENVHEDTSPDTEISDLYAPVKAEIEESNSSSTNLNESSEKSVYVGDRHECPHCNKTYKNKSHANRHIKSHCDFLTPPLYCEHCTFLTKQKGSLKRHMERLHGPNATPKQEYPRHLVVPTEGPPLKYRCTFCSKSYSHRFALDRHAALECKRESPSVAQERGGEEESRAQQEASGAEAETLPEAPQETSPAGKFPCPACGRRYKSLPSLYNHTRTRCGREADFFCAHCSFTTTAKRNLPKHFERKHWELLGLPHEDKRYKCPMCPRSYKHHCGLLQHVRFDCGRPPQFRCPHCPYVAKRKHHVASHVTNNHPKDGRSTDYRAMAFIPVDSLPAHVVEPCAMRRYQCAVCLKAFKYRADLNRHKEQRCGKNLRFGCPSCTRSYSRQDALDRHLRLECGKQPQFQCSECPYRAARKFSLGTHMRTKHSKT